VVSVVILGLFFISGFAGLLPVVSWGLECKWLIINEVRFCRFGVFVCLNQDLLDFKIYRMWAV
jgi:hypothetical protein